MLSQQSVIHKNILFLSESCRTGIVRAGSIVEAGSLSRFKNTLKRFQYPFVVCLVHLLLLLIIRHPIYVLLIVFNWPILYSTLLFIQTISPFLIG